MEHKEEAPPVRRVDLTRHEPQDLVDYMRGRRDLLAEEDAEAAAATHKLLEAIHELTKALNAASDINLIDRADVSRWLASSYALAAKVTGREKTDHV